MRRACWAAGLVGTLLAVSAPAYADVSAVKTDKGEVKVGGMLQVLGFGQVLNDPVKNDARVYLFMKEARLRASAQYDRYTFHLELGLGPEDTVLAPSPGIAIGLLDMNVDVRLGSGDTTFVKVGQFKVPYGREELTYSGNLLFADRSIENLGMLVGRDVGAAIVSQPGMLTLIGGIFTGGGRDVPPTHYLPETLGVPLLAARVGVGNVKEDPFYLTQTVTDVASPQWGLFVNGLYMKDSTIGHSTILNVKGSDRSLLLNAHWNPYIAQKPLDRGDWYQAGADAMVRVPLGAFVVSGEAQFDYAKFSNTFGSVSMTGARAQAAIALGPLEGALRYAVLFPDKKFAVKGVPVTGDQPLQEITPSASWYLAGDNLKLVVDLPVLLHVPVFNEPKVGSYVSTELPNEAALLGTGGSVVRQNVVEGRLMLQAQF